jgi:hypothetical protein
LAEAQDATTDNRRGSAVEPESGSFFSGIVAIPSWSPERTPAGWLASPHINEERTSRSSRILSAPQAELGYEAPVSLYVFATQIVEESPALADHEQQTTTAVVIVLVVTKMFGQVIDPLGEQSHLDFRRTGVTSVSPEFLDDFGSCLHCA